MDVFGVGTCSHYDHDSKCQSECLVVQHCNDCVGVDDVYPMMFLVEKMGAFDFVTRWLLIIYSN